MILNSIFKTSSACEIANANCPRGPVVEHSD